MPGYVGPERWRERLTHGAPLAVLLVGAGLVAYVVLPILELVAVAMLLALVLRTAADRLQEGGLRPWMSVAVLIGAFAAFGSFVWLVVAPNVLREASVLTASAPEYVDSLSEPFRHLSANVGVLPNLSHVADRLRGHLERLIDSIPGLLMGLGQAGGSVAATLILGVFMALDPESLISGTLKFVPQDHREEARRLLGAVGRGLRGWIVGTVLAMLFVATGAGLGLWLLGVPLPITFGLLAGLLNVVPYVGSIVGALLPALLALTISPVKALLVVVFFIVLNQIDGYVIQPLVMGREVRLHPVVVLLSFLFFGQLLGTVGLLLAVPATVLLKTLVDEIPSSEEPPEEDGRALDPARGIGDKDRVPSP